MRRYRNFTALGVVLLLTAAGCGRKEERAASLRTGPVITGVVVQPVAETAVTDHFVAVGTVRPLASAQVAARIAGTVTRVAVREGERVGRDKLLVVIEATEQAAGAAAALAGVEEARRGLEEARSRQRLAEATFARFSRLYQEQAATRQELENRQAELDVASQGAARAEAHLQQARESARAAGTVAGYGRVTAPISGVVTAKGVDTGMTVFPGMPLLTIEGEDGYRLEATVPEGVIARVGAGQTVGVAVDGTAAAGSGRIVEIVPAADPATRTFTVKVDLAGKGLKSGMFGRASFPAESRRGLLVPKAAVVERGGLTGLWVVDGSRVARLRLIKQGKEQGEKVEVVSGLTAGESIVVGGVERVTDGARIE